MNQKELFAPVQDDTVKIQEELQLLSGIKIMAKVWKHFGRDDEATLAYCRSRNIGDIAKCTRLLGLAKQYVDIMESKACVDQD